MFGFYALVFLWFFIIPSCAEIIHFRVERRDCMNFYTARIEVGITQTEAAESLGVSCASVSKWESGKTKPRDALLPKIAKLYRCKIDDLLKERK